MVKTAAKFLVKRASSEAAYRLQQAQERVQRVAGPHWTRGDMPDLTGKVVVVTGANSGIGFEATRQFVRKGAAVVMACRNLAKAEAALDQLGVDNLDGSAEIIELDLTSLNSIRHFVAQFQERHQRLDVLVNNAGIMMVPYGQTEDGFERQFGTNHLGHFALTGLLIASLKATPGARVVTVSSIAHRFGELDFFDPMYADGNGYSPTLAYGRSKLANLMFSYELQRRFDALGLDLTAVSAHPGASDTNLGAHLQDGLLAKSLTPLASRVMQSAAMGALPTLRAAVDKSLAGGSYVGPNGPFEGSGFPVLVGSSRRARSSAENARLWQLSQQLTNVHYLALPSDKVYSPTVSLHALESDTYATLDQLRETPQLADAKLPIRGTGKFVTRYDDVLMVLKDPRFSNSPVHTGGDTINLAEAWWLPERLKIFTNNMLGMDDPDHKRLRDLVHKAFTPRMIRELDGKIVALAHELLDAVAEQDAVDLVASFALPLPLTVISEMMGVPEANRPEFRELTADILNTSSGSLLEILRRTPNAYRIHAFFNRLIDQKRAEPGDDLTSALVSAEQDGDSLDQDELIAMLFLLLVAGHETTVNLIGSGILALLTHPDQFAKLKADSGLMDSAIEEMLRYCNPVIQVAPRYATETIDLNGQTIPQGTVVIAAIASANRDATRFEQPELFDIARKPNKHLAFGMGVHYCLGAPLARLEAKRAFEVLFERYPELELVGNSAELKWRESVSIRGLKALPVRLKPN